MNILIREIQPKDFGALVVLLKQLGYGGNDIDSLTHRCQVFKEHEGIVFVVEGPSGKVVGFAALAIMPMIHRDGFLARIAGICIDEDSRSAGIGAELIGFLENYCLEKNCALLEVTTNMVRVKAHQFYENNGFVETHRRFNKEPARRPSPKSH